MTDKATLDSRDDVTGEYEPFEAISADIAAIDGDVRDRVWRSTRARHTGLMLPNWQAWRNAELAARANAAPMPELIAHQRYVNGEYATPQTPLAFEIIGKRDGFTLYQDTAYMTNVPANAVLRRDLPLGGGMFSVEVWALAGSPFIITISDTGTTMAKPVGHAGWNRSISRQRLIEYFEPVTVWKTTRG